MSEKQRTLAEKIARLPEALQEKYLNRAEGAIEAMDILSASQTDTGGETTEKGG